MIRDTVLVERAGEVIPYIVKSVAEARNGNEKAIFFPSHCPSCDSKLVKPEEEAAWRCINAECPAQAIEKLKHYVSKNAMDIDGLGDKMVARLYELKLLKHIPDIYQLDYNQIQQLEGYGEKSIEKLKASIETSKQQPLHRLIFALGIRFVGQNTSKTIAASIGNLLELTNWSAEALMELEDVGTKVASSITSFMANPSNQELIETLQKLGINTSNNQMLSDPDSALAGKTFLFTGSLSSLSRSEAAHLLEPLGGKLMNTVSKKLDYLVVGKSPGSKLTKAQAISTITILDEQEFLKLIKK